LSLNAESLRKILELECNKGYVDSAVIGGLDRYLHNWAGQAFESINTPKLIARFNKLRLGNSDYASLNRDQRKEWIDKRGCPSGSFNINSPSRNCTRQPCFGHYQFRFF
jgi:hypothetical protein